jgi:hypothetical protein
MTAAGFLGALTVVGALGEVVGTFMAIALLIFLVAYLVSAL